jgi:DNA polymerase
MSVPDKLDSTVIIEGLKWIPGRGHVPARYMFVGEKPDIAACHENKVFVGPQAEYLFKILREVGFSKDATAYWTNAVKYMPKANKAIGVKDINVCRPLLVQEIMAVRPDIIVCMGANALKAVMGSKAKLSTYRSSFVDLVDNPTDKKIVVFSTYSPGAILRTPHLDKEFRKDFMRLLGGTGDAKPLAKIEYETITTVAGLLNLKQRMLSSEDSRPVVVLDAEWHGENWMDPNRYVRTVQLGLAPGIAIIVEFTDVGGKQVMDDPTKAWQVLGEILEDQRTQIIGHNVIADGQWLMAQGIDIRYNVIYDTMLMEHLAINELGPFDLMSLTLKYTDIGKYDLPLERWVQANPGKTSGGYGFIPREILLPYGAYDVDAPRYIMEKQIEVMARLDNLTKVRGLDGEYPCLWRTVMDAQRVLYEIEGIGLLVDRERLKSLSETYAKKLAELEKDLSKLVKGLDVKRFQMNTVTGVSEEVNPYRDFLDNFNPRSGEQIIKLLFEILGLTPVKTTSGKPWGRHMLHQNLADSEHTPATDKNTLEILYTNTKNPVIKKLLDVKKLSTTCTTFLNEDPEKGIGSNIWVDGRLHPRFSFLSDTGRFRVSSPNSQNWPKKAEGYMIEIFGGKEKVPPLIRTAIIPSPGFVLMEADFCQAEMFVAAALSRDENMLGALNTPGKDLHDLTAITGFGFYWI